MTITTIGGDGALLRAVFRPHPGTRHIVEIEMRLDGAAASQVGTTWTCELVDADTGAQVLEYDPDEITANVVTFTATAELTAALNPTRRLEGRITRVTPGPDLIVAGPVLFDPLSTPAVAA